MCISDACKSQTSTWTEGALRAMVPDNTKILWFTGRELPENSTYYEGIGPSINSTTDGLLGLAPNKRLLCAKQAVMISKQYTIFQSPAEWLAFRNQVMKKLGFYDKILPYAVPPGTRPTKVLFKKAGRNVINMEQLIKICRQYTTCEFSADWGSATFAEQVEAVASAGILVGSHGAGLTNAMFLHPYGALIELFPYKWWPDMFRRMTDSMGIAYYSLADFTPPSDISSHCYKDVTALEFPGDSCTHEVKSRDFRIDPGQFEVVLLQALQQIGLNAQPNRSVTP
jgi:hypothetical protein